MIKSNSSPSDRRGTNRSRSTTKSKQGRKSGARTKGYFYRLKRGWCASDKTPLTYQDGTKIKDRNAPVAELKAAYARYQAEQNDARRRANDKKLQQLNTSVGTVCNIYLGHCEATDAPTTFKQRADYLFDFCTGFPFRFRKNHGTKEEREKHRVHAGYGTRTVAELIKLDVDVWLESHPLWGKRGGRRSAIQTLKRAFNYCVEAGVIPHNPIKGFKAGKPGTRRSNITTDQEEAILKVSNKAFAEAIRILIRTGARYGCEFAVLTGDEVIDHGERMEWFWPDGTKVNSKERRILITDDWVIEIVRRQMARYKSGPLFRNSRGNPWNKESLSSAFERIRDGKRLAKLDVSLKGLVLYSCRHTYAKRTLEGHWTGRKTNIETLCKLMGNTFEVCWEHYAQWDSTRTEHFWQVV